MQPEGYDKIINIQYQKGGVIDTVLIQYSKKREISRLYYRIFQLMQ